VDTWPAHCVAGTPGADYDPLLDTAAVTHHVRKGQGRPAYSMFEGVTESGETVGGILSQRGVIAADVVGIATDHCVRASAADAIAHGVHVRVLTDLVAGVGAESSAAALAELARAGAELVTSGAPEAGAADAGGSDGSSDHGAPADPAGGTFDGTAPAAATDGAAE